MKYTRETPKKPRAFSLTGWHILMFSIETSKVQIHPPPTIQLSKKETTKECNSFPDFTLRTHIAFPLPTNQQIYNCLRHHPSSPIQKGSAHSSVATN